MLSIGAMGGWTATYYTSLAREDYYLEGGEPPGYWFGEAAEALGLRGEVGREELSRVLAGFSPDGSCKLVQNAGADDRQPGWDLTFTVPKSVSVLWANADRETRLEIRAALADANEKALEYIQAEAAFSRTGRGGTGRLPAKLLIASFEHATSRAGDPNLHRHNLVANLCVREDGQTRTIESLPLYQHKMAAGALFRAELSAQLERRLGLLSVRKESWFELSGVPQELLDEHSKRRAEIEELLAEKGFSSSAAADVANLITREAKEIMSRSELLAAWREIGTQHGFSERQVRELLGGGVERDRDAVLAAAVDAALEKAVQHEAYFTKRELVRSLAESLQGEGFRIAEILTAAEHTLAHSQVVRLGLLGGELRYTTQAMLDCEANVLARVERAMARCGNAVADKTLQAVTASLPHELTAEQAQALRHVTQAPATIRVVSGYAGTGKSFLLAAAREAFQREGFRVIGACLAGRTAEQLREDTDIETRTIASLLFRIEQAKQSQAAAPLTENTVLILDEAGMVGTRHFDAITEAVQQAGATLVLTGDRKQLQPIEAGGMFPRIAEELGEVRLTNIIRQRPDVNPETGEQDHWKRDAVYDLIQGNARKVLETFAERGLLAVTETEREAMQRLVADWRQDGLRRPQENVIFVATNVQAAELNRLCQAARRQDQGQAADEAAVTVGTQKFYHGDRVLFTEKSLQIGVQNGYFGEVIGFDTRLKMLHVRLDGGDAVTVPLQQYNKLRLGYAVTTHKGQGGTFDNVYALVGGHMQDLHISYVQGSRARHCTRLYTTAGEAGDKLTQLASQMSREREKQLAHTISQTPRP